MELWCHDSAWLWQMNLMLVSVMELIVSALYSWLWITVTTRGLQQIRSNWICRMKPSKVSRIVPVASLL